MVDKEAVKTFFFEGDKTPVGTMHYSFLEPDDISNYSQFELEAIYESIEKLHIITTMLEFEYGFKLEEEPKKNLKKYNQYRNCMFEMDKLEAYLDYIELDTEEKLMIKFLADKNQFTLLDARKGVKNFYERAVGIFPGETLAFFFHDDIDFCEDYEIATHPGFTSASFSGKKLFLSTQMLAAILAMAEKKSLPLGKQKLLDAFFNTFSDQMPTLDEIKSNRKNYYLILAESCWEIMSNASNLGLSKEQKEKLRKINLNSLKAIMLEHINNRPGQFYILPPAMKDIVWNGDENNIIYQVYNEPYVSYLKLSKPLRKQFAEDLIDVLSLAKSKGYLSSEDVVENLLAHNEIYRYIDSEFSNHVSKTLIENMKSMNTDAFILQDNITEDTIDLGLSLLNFIDTVKDKKPILDCLSEESIAYLEKYAKNNQTTKKLGKVEIVEKAE